MELDATAPVRQFPGGRARFRLYELPALSPGDTLELVQIDRIHKQHTPLVKPMLVLLDADRKALSTFAPETFERGYIGWKDTGKREDLTLDVRLAGARYAVVAVNPGSYGDRLAVVAVNPVILPGVAGVTRHQLTIPYATEGRARLRIRRGLR